MSVAPAPPQGPGVLAPFPAPPTEGRRLRVGWGLGIGAAVLLLVCGGGIAAVVGLTAVVGRALNEQADVVVSEYLEDVTARRYAEAYDSLCPETKATLTQAEFASEAAAEDPIRTFDVGELDLTSVNLAVPVDVTYADGRSARLQARLGQNQETGEFQVCSVGE